MKAFYLQHHNAIHVLYQNLCALECSLTYALFPKKDEFKFAQRIAKISRCCHGAGKQNY
jgi:hypothetical protein